MHSVLELFAGSGGMALGLERAGFSHSVLVEKEPDPSRTLRANRPQWQVLQADIVGLECAALSPIDMIAAGMPRPVSAHSEGIKADPSLIAVLRLVDQVRPKAVLIENVPSVASSRSAPWRSLLASRLEESGYDLLERIIGAAEYGVPQNRRRYVAIALRRDSYAVFNWPAPRPLDQTAGQLLANLMSENGWKGAPNWAQRLDDIAPAIVGGSMERGGADLGPSRSRKAWMDFGIDGRSIAVEAPQSSFPVDGIPKLTNKMVAALQGFPDTWVFEGSKTSVYRQIASASPPAVMCAVGQAVGQALSPNT